VLHRGRLGQGFEAQSDLRERTEFVLRGIAVPWTIARPSCLRDSEIHPLRQRRYHRYHLMAQYSIEQKIHTLNLTQNVFFSSYDIVRR
jgi:hypothetical protein